ncbi:hypothetical protein ASE01_12165 [Nocardioides sp. Root190]|uniref:VWA domain-containing protein n=1 Tax=Nocardioides sp. Root190 TaxID=1736488 RepID=UPI0006FC4417|nr:VWA domain-containing protein [Nocardioides sp. Root190]KRB75810.1 hypothetical protein ASE01_12165 [Nocardioides sp. Root190]
MVGLEGRRAGVALIGALILSASTFGGAAGAGTPEPNVAAPSEAPADDPVRRLGSCMASGQPTDVLLVLDRSSSLETTDPENERVDAAGYLVERLIAVADTSGADMSIAVAGFDVSFEITKKWTEATSARQGDLIDHLETYRTKNQGWETDYWEAVQGARTALAGRERDDAHCQAWVWFSDGSYDLDVRDSGEEQSRYGKGKPYADDELTSRKAVDSAVKAGVLDLCRAGGQADQLRAQDIVTLAVGLKAPGSDADFDLMKGIAEASGSGGESCKGGASPTPGAFIQASQVDELLFAFDEFASPNQKPIEQDSKLCPKRSCAEEAHTFVLDDSIGSVHILGTADASQKLVALQRDGMAKPILFDPATTSGAQRIGDVEVTSTWLSDDSLELDLVRGNGKGWAGLWSIVFIDPDAQKAAGAARSRIHLQGDIVPAWRGDDEAWHTGDTVEASFGLARIGSGENVPPAKIQGRAVVSAVLEVRGAEPIVVTDGIEGAAIGQPQQIDLDDVPIGDAVLRITLDLTTKSATDSDGRAVPGTELEPQSVDVPVQILAPADYPRVSTALRLGSIEELEPVDGEVTVTGPGCVWFAEARPATTLPTGVGSPRVTSSADSQESCVTLQEGEEGAVPLSFEFDALDNGAVNGAIQLKAVPTDGVGDPIAIDVDYTLEMRKPRDASTFWLALIGITLLGVLIPVAMLYLVKWVAARIPGKSLLLGRMSGTVDADGQFHPTAGGLLGFDQATMQTVFVGNGRAVGLPGGGQLIARMGLNPSAAGHVTARGLGGSSASSLRRRSSTRRREAILPSAVAGSWLVIVRAAHTGAAAEVIVFTNSSGSGLGDLVDDARSRIPDVVTALRSRMPASPQVSAEPPPSDQGWGAPSPTAPPDGSQSPTNGW